MTKLISVSTFQNCVQIVFAPIVENNSPARLPCDPNGDVSFVYDVVWVQVPGGPHKKDLLENLDRVPTYVQQLQFTVKNPTVGKAATFTKVDNVIQETKNLMNVISKVVTTCFVCATKVKIRMLNHRNYRSIHVYSFVFCLVLVTFVSIFALEKERCVQSLLFHLMLHSTFDNTYLYIKLSQYI